MNWEEAIKQAMSAQVKKPYGRKKYGQDEGASKAVLWRQEKIMNEGAVVSCVFTVLETILDAARLVGCEEEGDRGVSVETVEELKRWTFVYSDAYRAGVAGGFDALDLGYYVEPEEASFGDVAQIWDTNASGETVFGHSVIVLGLCRDDTAIATYSAEPEEGNVESWRHIVHPSTGKTRRWYIARPDGVQIERLDLIRRRAAAFSDKKG